MRNIEDHVYLRTTTGITISTPLKTVENGTQRINELLSQHTIIVSWFSGYNNDTSLKEIVDGSYGYPLSWQEDGKVDEEMNWHYSGDPVLEPLFIIHHENECYVQYNYGLCAIVQNDGSHIWGRVD